MRALSVEQALARRNHSPGGGPKSVAAQIRRAEGRLGLGAGDPEEAPNGGSTKNGNDHHHHKTETRAASPAATASREETPVAWNGPDGIVIRRAHLSDVTSVAGLMSAHVADGTLLPRPVSELYQCVREFVVAEEKGSVVGCASLRLLWEDMGEVRSLVVKPDHAGRGIGLRLVAAVLDSARALGVPRVIALTREVPFFEKAGFTVVSREKLPRKVWTDCVRCPKRHACDEVAVVVDLVPGASEAAERAGRSFVLPIPHIANPGELPVVQ
jgi:amino-acid N-acetyltransferase